MKLLILDGNSIVNRAFYGIKLLTTKEGRYTNAIVGFMNILGRLEEQTQPDAVAIAFDLKAPTFRHKRYAEYKANRHGMPVELAEQMPVLKDLLRSLGYVLVSKEGYEADDVIGTLSAHIGPQDTCYIATGDRDSLQLIRENVFVLLAATRGGKPETNLYDAERVKAEYNIYPKQVIDVKGLMGDASDNIPGVAGVGKKTAESLIERYGSLSYIYEHLEELEIKPGVRQKLQNGKDMAYLSYELATIDLEVPVETELTHYKKGTVDAVKAQALLAELEMFQYMKKLGIEDMPQEKTETKVLSPLTFSAEILQKEDYIVLDAKQTKNIYFLYTDNTVVYFATDTAVLKISLEAEAGKTLFLSLLEDETLRKHTYSSKEVYAFALRENIVVQNMQMDLTLAAYLLNPGAKEYALHRLVQEYVPSIRTVASADETAQDVANFLALTNNLVDALSQNDQLSLLYEIEIPLAEVLASMEKDGVLVDKTGIEAFQAMLSKRIEVLQQDIYTLAGESFNINSPKQLGYILFEKLEIPTKKKTKTGYSTNAEVLEKLADQYEIVRLILEYRSLAKLKSTYCDGLLKVIAEDGRIHSSFNQTETRTGRISSTEPNLQNIPVRQPLGREMRKFFTAKEGCVFVDADYSQIELRVLAHMANDTHMIEAFQNDADIHTITASQVFHMPPQMVTPLMRSRAKAVNFGIVYGIGAFSLGKDIGVSRKEAEQYIEDYLENYSGVKQFMDDAVVRAKDCGYAKTMFARRRYLPELASSNGMLRAFGARVAMNMPIQGTAADIIKIAMIRVYRRLQEENMAARLLLQIHDELIVEAPEAEAEKAKQIVIEEMENACKLSVPLKCDANIGKTWYDAKD